MYTLKSNFNFLIFLLFLIFCSNNVTVKASQNLIQWESPVESSEMGVIDGKINITNKADEYSNSTITLPDGIQSISDDLPYGIIFDSKQNLFLIDWTLIEISTPTIALPIQIQDTQSTTYLISVESKTLDNETINDKLSINIELSESQNSEISDISTYNSEDSTTDEVPSTSLNSSTDSNIDLESSSKIKEDDSQIEDESEDTSSETKKNQIQTFAATATGTSVDVSNWNAFEDALENSSVSVINIIDNIGTSSVGSSNISGDKIINANNKMLDFNGRRFNIQNYKVSLNNALVRTFQTSLFNDNASLFYSTDSGQLTINNVSYSGEQRGQVARLPKGEIIVKGTNYFEFTGPFEVFEANQIIFKKDSSFKASNKNIAFFGSSLNELINLYGKAVITIEENAEVNLELADRMSIINNGDTNGSTEINLEKNSKLNIIAGDAQTSDGQSLIHLPGANSSIKLSEGATLNIENQRTQNPGNLISMNGSLQFFPDGNKLDLEDFAGNKVSFPRIYEASIFFKGNKVDNVTMGENSSRANSENSTFHGADLNTLLKNPDTFNLKKMTISPISGINQPTVDRLTDTDVTLIGTAEPSLNVTASDSFNNEWSATTDESTGKFNIDLGKFAPYKVGSEIKVTVSDNYGHTSEDMIVTVQGNRLSFNVPDQLKFKQVAAEDTLMTILRDDPNWQIKVTNTTDSSWKLTAKEKEPLSTANGNVIENGLVLKKNEETSSLSEEVLIYQQSKNGPKETRINWNKDNGLLLQLNPIEQNVEYYKPYTTTIEWTLTDAP